MKAQSDFLKVGKFFRSISEFCESALAPVAVFISDRFILFNGLGVCPKIFRLCPPGFAAWQRARRKSLCSFSATRAKTGMQIALPSGRAGMVPAEFANTPGLKSFAFPFSHSSIQAFH